MNGGNRIDFGAAAATWAVLEYLGNHTPVQHWLVVREVAGGYHVLVAHDRRFGLTAKQLVPHDLAEVPSLSAATWDATPIRLPDGDFFGALIALSDAAEVPALDRPLVEVFAASIGTFYAADIAATRAQHRFAHSFAKRDTLTGLLNRQSWQAHLRDAESQCSHLGDSAAVLIIDLDELKAHNETHGHESGDDQLREAAALVLEVAGDEHIAARITGNIFGVLLLAYEPGDVAAVETALRQSLSRAGIAASVGVGQRREGSTVSDAVAEAEAAVVATHTVHKAAPASAEMSAQHAVLVEALDRGAIRAYFQPIVDLRTGDVVSIEALARWQVPDGVREPGEFLPQIVEAGLLGALFDRILADGLEHLAEFRHISPELVLSVNFEFDTIPDGGLLDCIIKRLAEFDMPASALAIELGERQTFELSPDVRKQLVAVADLGVQLMLDDFGTGFASLETLTSLPIRGVKLDRRFTSQVVSGDREPAVVKAMIAMAAEAGLTVVAEGIETQMQCDRLIRLGCKWGQGYLFALPQPPDLLATVLSGPLVSTF